MYSKFRRDVQKDYFLAMQIGQMVKLRKHSLNERNRSRQKEFARPPVAL